MRGITICVFLLFSLAVNASNDTETNATTTTPTAFTSTTITTKTEADYIKCDPNSYESKQCKFGGTCIQNTRTLDMKCNCTDGYTGALCELPRGLTYCYNGGLNKLDTNTNKTSCKCTSTRFSGEQCQFDKCRDVPKCGKSCYMTSECKCICGHDCSLGYCTGNGECIGNSDRDVFCKCKAGYSGPTCYTDDCLGFCFNNGRCLRNNNSVSCDCPIGYKSDPRCGVKDTEDVKGLLHQVRAKARESGPPSDFRSTRIIMYALSITLFICLISIGGYVAIQRGMLTCLLSSFEAKNAADNSPLSTSYARLSEW